MVLRQRPYLSRGLPLAISAVGLTLVIPVVGNSNKQILSLWHYAGPHLWVHVDQFLEPSSSFSDCSHIGPFRSIPRNDSHEQLKSGKPHYLGKIPGEVLNGYMWANVDP